jgi:hypothetical protein
MDATTARATKLGRDCIPMVSGWRRDELRKCWKSRVHLSVRRHRQHMSFAQRRLVQSFARWPVRRQRKQGVLGQECTLPSEGDMSLGFREFANERLEIVNVRCRILPVVCRAAYIARARSCSLHALSRHVATAAAVETAASRVRTKTVEGGGRACETSGRTSSRD